MNSAAQSVAVWINICAAIILFAPNPRLFFTARAALIDAPASYRGDVYRAIVSETFKQNFPSWRTRRRRREPDTRGLLFLTTLFAGISVGTGHHRLSTALGVGLLVAALGAVAIAGNLRQPSPRWAFLPTGAGYGLLLVYGGSLYWWLLVAGVAAQTFTSLAQRARKRGRQKDRCP